MHKLNKNEREAINWIQRICLFLWILQACERNHHHRNLNDIRKKDTCSNGWSIFNSLQSKVYNSTILSKECQIRDDLENCLRYQMHHLDYFNNIYLEGHSGIMYSESACSFYLRTSHGVMSGFPSRHFLLNRAKTTLRFHDGVGSIIQTRYGYTYVVN